jgi:hypothetical protein
MSAEGEFKEIVSNMSNEQAKRVLMRICTEMDNKYNSLNRSKNQNDYVEHTEWAYDLVGKSLRKTDGGSRKTRKNRLMNGG